MVEIAPLACHEGKDVGRFLHHTRRGSEHHPGTDEDVPDQNGLSSKVVVTGDLTQIDLPRRRFSGLEEGTSGTVRVEEWVSVYFNDQDVVRHELVQRIVRSI